MVVEVAVGDIMDIPKKTKQDNATVKKINRKRSYGKMINNKNVTEDDVVMLDKKEKSKKVSKKTVPKSVMDVIDVDAEESTVCDVDTMFLSSLSSSSFPSPANKKEDNFITFMDEWHFKPYYAL